MPVIQVRRNDVLLGLQSDDGDSIGGGADDAGGGFVGGGIGVVFAAEIEAEFLVGAKAKTGRVEDGAPDEEENDEKDEWIPGHEQRE